MSVIKNSVHPWTRGFQPPQGFCRRCRRISTLVYTGEVNKSQNHVYRCSVCSADIVAPTMYAFCNINNTLLEKDVFYTPCIHGGCTRFKGLPHSPARCEHLKPVDKTGGLDPRQRRDLERRMINTKPVEKQPPDQPTSPGVSNEVLEHLRRERLRKLREVTK